MKIETYLSALGELKHLFDIDFFRYILCHICLNFYYLVSLLNL